MRKKPAPPIQTRWEDGFVNLEHEDAKVRFYNTGMITFNGSIKNAAIAVAKHLMDDMSFIGILNYLCINYNFNSGEKYTINWVGGGVIPNDKLPEPKYWAEFKEEFERYCELKAFF